MSQGISGKRIKLDIGFRDLPWSVIYDLKRKEQIATNGSHEGIIVRIDSQEFVFDNICHTGVDKAEWLSNLSSPTIELERGKFKITEEAF
jgi:Papain fold toxin 2